MAGWFGISLQSWSWLLPSDKKMSTFCFLTQFANLFRTWNVGFNNRDLTLNFNDVYSAIVNILQEDNAKFSKREFANYIKKV